MKQVNAQSCIRDSDELEMGIGLNSGDVIVGNIGCEKRTKYGVVGKHVNLASRIESLTCGGQILISETTRRKLGDRLRIANRIEVTLKGLQEPVPVYEVTGIGEPYNLALPHESPGDFCPLAPPLNVELCLFAEKAKGQTSECTRIRRLSPKGAYLETDIPLEPFQNVQLTVARAELRGHAHFRHVNTDELPEKMEIQAKVMKAEDHLWRVRFTHVDKHFRRLNPTHGNGMAASPRRQDA